MPRLSRAQRRESFIEAAVRVIARHGVDGATTRRIAEEAGQKLAALHYCFASKEELLFAIWEEQVVALRERMIDGVTANSLGEAAAIVLRQMMDYFRTDEDFALVQIELLFWALRQEGELGAKAYDIHASVVEDVLRTRGNATERDEDVAAVAALVLSLVDGINVQWFSYRSHERLERDITTAQAALRALHPASAT